MDTITSDEKLWRTVIEHGIWICVLVLALFYHWFAVANRYSIFLYTHLGAEPFDAVTRSRYWMSGLVASGAVLVLNIALNWLLGRLNDRGRLVYRPPRWQRVWLVCAVPLALGIIAITMTQNWPTLPLDLALAAAGATLVGLALALPAGPMAAQKPAKLAWLTLYGCSLMPLLLVFHAVELPSRGLMGRTAAWTMTVSSLVVTVALLAGLHLVRRRLKKTKLAPIRILVAGLTVNYLLLPLVHHLFATPPDHRYITTASNFFAFSPVVQGVTWFLAILVVYGLDWLMTLRQKREFATDFMSETHPEG